MTLLLMSNRPGQPLSAFTLFLPQQPHYSIFAVSSRPPYKPLQIWEGGWQGATPPLTVLPQVPSQPLPLQFPQSLAQSWEGQ